MRRGFGGIVYSSFKKVYNGVVGVAGIVIAILVYIFAFPDDDRLRVVIGTAALIMTVLLVLLLTFADAAYELYIRGPNVLPKVRAGMEPLTDPSAALACMTDPSELFTFGIWVSFWRVTEQGAEKPMGIGNVVNVQEDGKILMEMTSPSQEHKDFVRQLRENNADALAATRVKPYVPQQLFGSYEEQR